MAGGAATLGRRPFVDRLALACEGAIDRPRPLRRTDLFDQILKMSQAIEVRREAAEIIDEESIVRWCKNAKYAEHFAEITRQPQNVVAVVGKAGPLGLVLDRRVPQERIAHRRVGPLDVAGDDVIRGWAEVETGEAVEYHTNGVKPRRSPSLGRQSAGDQCVVAQIPSINALVKCHDIVGVGCGGVEDRIGKGVEGSIAATHLSHGAVEIGEEALEIDDPRAAIDPVKFPLCGDLPGVASRACHADSSASGWP